ncbi:reverse transcriptase domain-containing protein [Tanacetum coccineum]
MLKQPHYSKYTKALSECEDSGGGHWKLRSRKQKLRNARVWFDDLPSESIDSYDNLKKAFLENYLQQKKYIKDPIELHNIKQQDGESMKDFVRRYKLESRDVKGAPECMRIFEFGEAAASNHERKKLFPSWKQQEGTQRQNFQKGGFRNQQSGKEQPKTVNKGETFGKDEALAILMVQPWERVARQKITQSFSSNTEIVFPPLDEDEGTEGTMIIEAEIGGHFIHHIYVDGGSASKILIGDEEHSASAWMNFVVVRSPSSYNEIIERPGVRKLQAVPSTAHGMLKLPVEGGIITLKSSRLVLLECALVSGPEETPQAPKLMVEERFRVAINPEHLE